MCDQNIISSSENNFKKIYTENFKTSTPISTKVNVGTKNDSAYSSFVSQKAHSTMNSNHSLIKDTNPSYGSPGTSISSRNSALVNDDEMEELFKVSNIFDSIENERNDTSFFISEQFYRRSARNSPWPIRPDSAPLNEEEEDSDKEASNYFCNLTDNFSNSNELPEIVQCTLQSKTKVRHNSMNDADQRNEMIAIKLQQIADKLPSIRQKRVRQKSYVYNSSNSFSYTNKRHSYSSSSSFTNMMPNSMGSALDLIISIYNIYKQNPQISTNKSFDNSETGQNTSNPHRRFNKRNRSYTD